MIVIPSSSLEYKLIHMYVIPDQPVEKKETP